MFVIRKLMLPQNPRSKLYRLLQLRNEHPEKIAAIDAEINQAFLETHAIVVLDMSGCSRLTMRHSIIHFLAMVRQLCTIAFPIVEQYQGSVVKQEADNIFAVFPAVEQAIAASIDIINRLAVVNTGLPDSQDLHVCIGVGYGEVLMIESSDLYGNQMNLDCKLGEDLGQASEILLTEAAFAQVGQSDSEGLTGSGCTWERLEFSISGLELVAYKLQFPIPLLN